MTDSTTKIPVWYWIVGVLALLWNGLGVMAYLGQAFMTDEMIAQLPEEQQAELLIEHPSWYTAAFAIAVFFGFLGCLALLIKKKWAMPLLIISLLGVLVQHGYLFANDYVKSFIMPIMIVVVSLALVYLAKTATDKGWIK